MVSERHLDEPDLWLPPANSATVKLAQVGLAKFFFFLSCFNLLRSLRFSGQIYRIPTSNSDRKQSLFIGLEKMLNDMRRQR